MGFRFHRRIKLFSGVHLNIGKTGVSTSIGRPGASVNFGKAGTRTTLGVPGTGVSYTETSSHGSNGGLLVIVAIVLFFLWLAF